jgi:hypothetical protein
MMKAIVVTVLFLLFVLPSLANDCGKIIPEKFEEYNKVELRGYFFHPDHCFSVVIPDKVVRRDHSEPQSHHGFGAVLSKPPQAAYLYVGTDPAGVVEDDNGKPGTPEDEAKQAIKWLVQDGAIIIRKDIKKTKLGGLPAARATIIYRCANSSVELVQDSIFAAEPNGPLHKLTLTASKPAYESARKILGQIAATWKLERRKCEEELKKRLKEDF